MLNDKYTFTHEGHTYSCQLRMAGVSAAPPPAIESNAFWSVEMDGVERKVFDAERDDLQDEETVQDFEKRVIAAMAPYVSE